VFGRATIKDFVPCHGYQVESSYLGLVSSPWIIQVLSSALAKVLSPGDQGPSLAKPGRNGGL
jgi:hypothetical protein